MSYCPRCDSYCYKIFDKHVYCPGCDYTNLIGTWHPLTEEEKLAKLRASYRIVSHEEMQTIKLGRAEQVA